jgi:hypothetical protein
MWFTRGAVMSKSTPEVHLEDLKASDLSAMAATTADLCVTLFLPTHQSGPDTRQDPIRFRNCLDRLAELLKEQGVEDVVTEPLRLAVSDANFWQHQRQALAIFARDGDVRFYRLRQTVDEEIHIGQKFYLKPLLGRLAGPGDFYGLSLTWDEVKLYRAENNTWRLVETTHLPATFTDLIGERDPEESLQHHSVHPRGSVSNSAIFHGHGEGESEIEGDRRNYLLRSSDLIADEIYNKGIPCILLATKEVAGHFQALSGLTFDAKLAGSPSRLPEAKERELFEEAAAALNTNDLATFAERFGTAMAHGLGTDKLKEVVTAAAQGRIDTLVVAAEKKVWGIIDSQQQSVELSQDQQGVELLNETALQTLLTGGEVFACPTQEMPGGTGTVAAIYRY